MASLNAFVREPINLPSNGAGLEEDNARQPKRIRLSDDYFAAIQSRCTHEATSLEVDHMILDYTAYHAIKACLASRDPEQQSQSSISLSASLSMSNAFLSIFKARHPTYKADPELKFRIKLLKLVTLFTQRLTLNPTTPSENSMAALRQSNQERAWKWIGTQSEIPSSIINTQILDDELPAPSQNLERNREHVLQDLGIPPEDEDRDGAFYGTSSCVSLLDILTLFMEVSAARNAMNASSLSERWMKLASEFMLQACLEQYLVVGAQGSDVVDEAFAWGYKGNSDTERQQNAEINDMFEDEEYATEVEGWSETKTTYLKQLLQPIETEVVVGTSNGDGVSIRPLLPHLEKIAGKFPTAPFETSILEYLEALSKSVPDPVLVQLESGKLDGMTEEETQDFLADCGVNMARLFEV